MNRRVGSAGLILTAVGVAVAVLSKPEPWVLALTLVGIVLMTLALKGRIGPKPEPDERLQQAQAAEELERREQEERQKRDSARAREERDAARRDQLHDIDLMRRAIVLELRRGHSTSITFGAGQHSRNDGTRRTYWLQDGELRGSYCRVRGSSSQRGTFRWPRGSIPEERSGQSAIKAQMKDAGRIERLYGELRYERLLVERNLPDEPLRCLEP